MTDWSPEELEIIRVSQAAVDANNAASKAMRPRPPLTGVEIAALPEGTVVCEKCMNVPDTACPAENCVWPNAAVADVLDPGQPTEPALGCCESGDSCPCEDSFEEEVVVAKAADVVVAIGEATTVDDVKALSEGDTRATVVKAAEKRLAALDKE